MKNNVKKAFIETNNFGINKKNTCNSCLYYSEEMGKNCHYLSRFFVDGELITIEDEYKQGCDKYKYWRMK